MLRSSLAGGLAGMTAPLPFELTRPLKDLFNESELQEAFLEQECWEKPGAALCVWVGWLSTLRLSLNNQKIRITGWAKPNLG